MFSELIRKGRALGDRVALVAASGETPWGELSRRADAFTLILAAELPNSAARRIGVSVRPLADTFAALAALDQLKCDVFLFDGQLSEAATRQLAGELDLNALVAPDDTPRSCGVRMERLSAEPRSGGESTVTILTSGTTGKPKAARHTWQSLSRPIRRGESNAAQRWLLSYRPHLYAGLQVMLQCWVNDGTLIVDDSQGDVAALARLMAERGVEYVSATPSYWRRLFMHADAETLAAIKLKQITLGGEVVDQPILTALSQAFPTARIVHIYATTELGRCFSVTDALAGFPRRFLDGDSPDGVRMTIDDGELLVRSANRMHGYDARSAGGLAISADAWVRTGDLVEVRGERVYFVGRRSDIINAGGNKVSPITVERVIRETPGVADVRVYGKSSSIAGQLVVCDVVPAAGCDPQTVQHEVAKRCRESLAAHERPRLISIVDRIELTAAGKTRRVEPANDEPPPST